MLMKKLFEGTYAATVMLWVYALAFAIGTAVTAGGELPVRAAIASQVAMSLILGWWVEADARKRGRRLCYDYGSFVYFLWPVVVPVYLFRTRGLHAFITLLCFAGIWAVAI